MAPTAFAPSANAAQSELTFATKYYGSCTQIPCDAETPDIDTVLDFMSARKADGEVVRANMTFTEQGAEVTRRKSWEHVADWHSSEMLSCITTVHPNSKSRRIGLLKIRENETNELSWHLFKYYPSSKTDILTQCFKYVIDCGLRELGRAYANQLAQENGQQTAQDWSGPPTSDPEPAPPLYDDAVAEIVQERRGSVDSNVFYEDTEEDFAYMIHCPC
eukprot:m.438063 g.438063  ORF g.438063 m.438063 type:complete len:218 (-) comp18188_c0_seq1:115-768(-)